MVGGATAVFRAVQRRSEDRETVGVAQSSCREGLVQSQVRCSPQSSVWEAVLTVVYGRGCYSTYSGGEWIIIIMIIITYCAQSVEVLLNYRDCKMLLTGCTWVESQSVINDVHA